MTNPNDPANPHFEVHETNSTWVNTTIGGLTKREYFAAMAMSGIHAMYANSHVDLDTYSQKICASQAVIMADALIAELNK